MDMKEVFTTLEGASGEGLGARSIVLGDSVDDKRGSLGFAFRDLAGNATMPRLTGDGRIPVSSDAAGTPLKARGEVVAGSASGSFATVCSIPANNDAVYTKFSGKVSCRRAALFQLVHLDNGAANILSEVLLDAGQFSEGILESTMEVTGGSTGAQSIVIRAFNLDNQQSNLRGNINCIEVIS